MRVCVYVFLALIFTLVLCARSQEFVMSVSVRRVHVLFSFAGFKGGGKDSNIDVPVNGHNNPERLKHRGA